MLVRREVPKKLEMRLNVSGDPILRKRRSLKWSMPFATKHIETSYDHQSFIAIPVREMVGPQAKSLTGRVQKYR